MSASAVYEGWIRHRRFEPIEHDFRYRLFLVYLDLDGKADREECSGLRDPAMTGVGKRILLLPYMIRADPVWIV